MTSFTESKKLDEIESPVPEIIVPSTTNGNGTIESYKEKSVGTSFLDFFRSYKLRPDNEFAEVHNSEDFLKPRHLQMIAIGSCIGTGLFVSTGKSLKNAGPGSLMINFIILSAMILALILSLGEMCCFLPNQSSITMYTGRLLNNNIGFAQSWLYFWIWLTVLPSEISAACEVVDFWTTQHLNPAIWVTIFLAYVVLVNAFGARSYGECEFVSSFLKVVIVIIFFFVAIIINCGAAPKGGYIGAHYWHHPGSFRNGFKGFCSVFISSAYSLSGTENIGTAAGNTSNPQRAIPSAVKKVFYRMGFFYIITIFLITLVVPYDNPDLGNVSPFIIAIKNGGIHVLPHITNAVILVSVLSVGNAAVFAASRNAMALVKQGWAPRFLGRVDQKGRPVISYLCSLAMACIAYVNAAPDGSVVFDWLMSVSGGGAFVIWGLSFIDHIRLRYAMKAQKIPDTVLPYKFPGSVYLSYYGVLINFLALCALVYISIFPVTHEKPSAYGFFVSFLGPSVFIAYLLISPIFVKPTFQSLKDVDLTTGRYDLVNSQMYAAESSTSELSEKDLTKPNLQSNDNKNSEDLESNTPPQKRSALQKVTDFLC